MSSKEKQVEQLTTYMANFVSYIGKVLPDDIIAKLDELAEKEDSPLSKVIYETMKKNQVLAKTLNRPSCQDTGVLQFWVKCGTNFPLIGELEAACHSAGLEFNWFNTYGEKTFLDYVKTTAMEHFGVTRDMGTELYQKLDIQVFYSKLLDLDGNGLSVADTSSV